LTKLQYLYLNSNNLTGTIPDFPPTLEQLWLFKNNLMGTIPILLGQLNLNSLDLTESNLCGCYPFPRNNSRKWQTCYLSGIPHNLTCTPAPSSCLVDPPDETVECGVNQCVTGTHRCAKERNCIPKKTAGYTCDACFFQIQEIHINLYETSGPYGCIISQDIWLLGFGIGGSIFFILLGAILFTIYHNTRRGQVLNLPNAIFWDMKRVKSEKYIKRRTTPCYYYHKVKPGTLEEEWLNELKAGLDCFNTEFYKQYALVTPKLVGNMSNARENQSASIKAADFKKGWTNRAESAQRTFVMQMFNEKCQQWNHNEALSDEISNSPVLPVVYGTNKEIAEKIASRGFSEFSIAGYFGTGNIIDVLILFINVY